MDLSCMYVPYGEGVSFVRGRTLFALEYRATPGRLRGVWHETRVLQCFRDGWCLLGLPGDVGTLALLMRHREEYR
jgi:hypothetical protein